MKISKKEITDFAVFLAIITAASAAKEVIHHKNDVVEPSITNNENKSNSLPVVFLDSNGTLHTDSECKGIKAFMTVDTILVNETRVHSHNKICGRCVTESQFEELNI